MMSSNGQGEDNGIISAAAADNTNRKVCGSCGKVGGGRGTSNDSEDSGSAGPTIGAMMRCSKCKSVRYCSEACQKKDWKTHRLVCCPPMSETEIVCSREIDRLLEEAARQLNFGLNTQIAFGGLIYYNAAESTEAKNKYGCQRLLEMLKSKFQCQSEECCNIENDLESDPPDEDGKCPRLGYYFIPNQAPASWWGDDDEDEAADEEFQPDKVTIECLGCYEKHAIEAEDGLDRPLCWTAENADQYFAFSGQLKTSLTNGCNQRGNWNQRSPFGGDVNFAANQVTWGALRLVNKRSIFAFYMMLIEKAERAERA